MYSSTEEGCIRAGYDRGVLQVDGTWKGSYRCLCDAIAVQDELDWQIYELYVAGEAPKEIIYASPPR